MDQSNSTSHVIYYLSKTETKQTQQPKTHRLMQKLYDIISTSVSTNTSNSFFLLPCDCDAYHLLGLISNTIFLGCLPLIHPSLFTPLHHLPLTLRGTLGLFAPPYLSCIDLSCLNFYLCLILFLI